MYRARTDEGDTTMTNEQVKQLRLSLELKNGVSYWVEENRMRLFTKAWDSCVYPMFGKGDVERVPSVYAQLASKGEAAWNRPAGFAVNLPK